METWKPIDAKNNWQSSDGHQDFQSARKKNKQTNNNNNNKAKFFFRLNFNVFSDVDNRERPKSGR